LVGLCPQDYFPQDIAEQFCANYSRCVEQRQPIRYQESFEIEQRSYTLLTTLAPKIEPDGRISRIIGSSQDITPFRELQSTLQVCAEPTETTAQAKTAPLHQLHEQSPLGNSVLPNNWDIQESLCQEKELLATLIENAPIGIISTDESGKILLVNPAYERICGYSSEELLGQTPPYPYWNLADLETIYHQFGLAMSGKAEHIELWFTRKNGDRFLARLKPITIFDEQGNMLRHLATMEDITKYKQAEKELGKALVRERELNELKSGFIAMISHEYRTPLATILSSTELLEHYRQKLTEEQKLKHYHRIKTSVQELTQLVDDVLDISKIEAGKQDFHPAPLNLGKFCSELVKELQLIIGKEHTLIFTNHSDGKLAEEGSNVLASAYMDEKLLRSLIANLVSNAIKYSPQGSTVRVDLVGERGQAILHIQDQGIGIPQQDQQQLFQLFHRGSNVGSTSGTGLGLSIVKSAVDLHGGQIAVESEVGVGTTVTVTLPLHEPLTREIEPNFSIP
jgi:PAS domain S-box-containing protein